MKSVCFTGHRHIDDTYELKLKLIEKLKVLINDGAEDFYAGGAVGWDTFCAQAVIALKKQYPHIRLNLVLPCSNKEQTAGWSDNNKKLFRVVFDEADSVQYTSEHYVRGCMRVRNARLVELADCCVCYYIPENFASGTGQTVRMAEKKGIPVFNIFE